MTVSEHNEQVWFSRMMDCHHTDVLWWSSANGGKRDRITAARMKQGGNKAGVPDIFIAEPVGIHHGLFIELKRKTGGIVSRQQIEIMGKLDERGYLCAVAKGGEEAYKIACEYLGAKCKHGE